MGTSLEIFILALVDQGLATPYDLRRAGISVGAAHPALQRLLKRNLLVKGQAQARSRSEYQLTKAGREALRSWPDLLRTYQQEVPSDVESVLRVSALAWVNGKKREAITLLESAGAAWAGKVEETQQNLPIPSGRTSDLASLYKTLIARLERGRIAGEQQALRRLTKNLRPNRK